MSMVTLVYGPIEDEIRPVVGDAAARQHFFSTNNKTTPMLDLDKSWHGLHYLLTGSAWEGEGPEAFLVSGGELIDLDVRSARIFWPDEVQTIDVSLTGIPADELRRRFNPQAMMAAEVYPQIWDRDPKEDDTLGELVSRFEKLKQFVHDARAQGRCLVVENEWPAVADEAAATVDQTRARRPHANPTWKRLAPFATVILSAVLTVAIYPIIPRSGSEAFREIAILYFLAALAVMVLGAVAEWCVRKFWREDSRGVANLRAGTMWAGIHFFLVLCFVIVGKLFGFV